MVLAQLICRPGSELTLVVSDNDRAALVEANLSLVEALDLVHSLFWMLAVEHRVTDELF